MIKMGVSYFTIDKRMFFQFLVSSIYYFSKITYSKLYIFKSSMYVQPNSFSGFYLHLDLCDFPF